MNSERLSLMAEEFKDWLAHPFLILWWRWLKIYHFRRCTHPGTPGKNWLQYKWWQTKAWFYIRYDRIARKRMNGMTGTFPNGSTWRVVLPPDDKECNRHRNNIVVLFTSPAMVAGAGAMISPRKFKRGYDLYEDYERYLADRLERLDKSGLELAESGEEGAFTVRWSAGVRR